MLSLLIVQISASVALVATLVGLALGISRRRSGGKAPRTIATLSPARGTHVLWIAATLAAIFWPVAFFLLPSYAYHWPSFADFPSSSAVQLAGVALGVSGGLLYSRSAAALGSQMTPVIQLQEGHLLTQTGPYRFVRHPVYTAIVMIAFGQTLLFLSLPVAALTVVLVGLAVYRAHLEEDFLSSAPGFGPEYRSYARRTGRFLPRFRAVA